MISKCFHVQLHCTAPLDPEEESGSCKTLTGEGGHSSAAITPKKSTKFSRLNLGRGVGVHNLKSSIGG